MTTTIHLILIALLIDYFLYSLFRAHGSVCEQVQVAKEYCETSKGLQHNLENKHFSEEIM